MGRADIDPFTLPEECVRDAGPGVRSPERRFGPENVARRRELENRPQRFGAGRKWIPLQVFEPLMDFGRRVLERIDLYAASAARATRLDMKEKKTWILGLPEALVGLRILHLSDLHIDGLSGFGEKLAQACSTLDFDVACITGDLRLSTRGPIDACVAEMKPLIEVLTRKAPTFAVLGNHDVFDLVAPLEAMGVTYLLNENRRHFHNGHEVWFAGVDDAHYYGTDDLDRAVRDIPVEATTILLAHSPDLIREAADAYVNFYLCGHTHGGQLCLPGGRPIVSNANCPRRFAADAWRLGSMCGYTSRGVGFSGLPLRTFCRAEVVVHVLERERRRRGRLAIEAARGRV